MRLDFWPSVYLYSYMMNSDFVAGFCNAVPDVPRTIQSGGKVDKEQARLAAKFLRDLAYTLEHGSAPEDCE